MFWVSRGGDEAAGRAVPDLHLGDLADQHRARADPEGRRACRSSLTAHSPCFRSEAGSAGRDTRGMIRQHQFDKVEMVQVVHPEHSDAALRRDGRPRRARAAGARAAVPRGAAVQRRHELRLQPRPTTSRSGCRRRTPTARSAAAPTARRSRRVACKRAFSNAQGKTEFVHTLNGSGLAVGRTLVAVLENGQRADGSIEVPRGAATLPRRRRGAADPDRLKSRPSLVDHERRREARRDGRVVECAGLEIRFTGSPVTWVRIPLSPPPPHFKRRRNYQVVSSRAPRPRAPRRTREYADALEALATEGEQRRRRPRFHGREDILSGKPDQIVSTRFRAQGSHLHGCFQMDGAQDRLRFRCAPAQQ